MRVKLFWKNEPMKHERAVELEAEINQWLAANPTIKVVEVAQSSIGSSFAGSLWCISVWYEERV
jgi:hypothetical protein